MVQKLKTSRENQRTVALTGSFGSGKSEVRDLFKSLGAYAIDADRLAHEALKAGSDCYGRIQALFPKVESHRGELNRAQIADVIFGDPDTRKKLESIVHPFVLNRIQQEVLKAQENVIVVEVPLLFEAGFEDGFDQTVVVKASDETIKKRLLHKGFTADEIEARLRSQMPQEQKISKADVVIDNSGLLNETKRKVEQILKDLS